MAGRRAPLSPLRGQSVRNCGRTEADFLPVGLSAYVHLQTPLALALESQSDAGNGKHHGHTTQTKHGHTGLG